jgi:hypothetical protein
LNWFLHFQQAGKILASTGDIELAPEQIWLTPQLMNDLQELCQTRDAAQNEISHGAIQQKIQARYNKFERQTIQKLPSFLISSPPIELYRFVPQKIADGLSVKFSNNSANLIFPGDILHPKNLLQYHHGNRIFLSYIEASDVNLRTISDCFVSQITVLISDIRCLVVDFTRQLTMAPNPAELLYLLPSLGIPPEFLVRPWSWRIDWILEHYLPVLSIIMRNCSHHQMPSN